MIGDVEGIIGSNLSDHITGDGSGTTIYGYSGDDVLRGGGGDLLIGGDGADKLYGMAGDVLVGGSGADEYYFTSGVLTKSQYDTLDAEHQSYYWQEMLASVTFSDGYSDIQYLDPVYVPVITMQDLEPEDRIYVDGKLIHGANVTVEAVEGSYYGGISNVSEQYSWLEGSAYNHGGQGFTGIEDYDFFDSSEGGAPPTVMPSGSIELVHGTGFDYPANADPVGYFGSIDNGIVINIKDLSAGGGGIAVDETFMSQYQWSNWTQGHYLQYYTYDENYQTIPTQLHF